MNRNKLRITDIAALPNVSTGTVDRVLHDREDVVEEAKKTILSSVDKIEYALNLLAESFSSKKHYQISVLIPDSSTDNTYCRLSVIGIKKNRKRNG